MTRVAVIGNAGGGKSTMCRSLSHVQKLPYPAIDKMHWKPNWVPTSDTEYNQAHDELISKPYWIIDGYGPWPSIERRLLRADTIIFVDHSIRIHFWWAIKRQFTSLIWGRPDRPDGCKMWPVTFRLLKMMWHLHNERRPKLFSLINKQRDHARIFHIKSPRELKEFAARHCVRYHPNSADAKSRAAELGR